MIGAGHGRISETSFPLQSCLKRKGLAGLTREETRRHVSIASRKNNRNPEGRLFQELRLVIINECLFNENKF